MNTQLNTIKTELKAHAEFLKHHKLAFKEDQRHAFKVEGRWELYYDYPKTAREECSNKYNSEKKFGGSIEYRHTHIAYSLMRGKTLRQIENNIDALDTEKKYSEKWWRRWYKKIDLNKVKKYYDQYKPTDYPEFPEKLTYDTRLTKLDGWVTGKKSILDFLKK